MQLIRYFFRNYGWLTIVGFLLISIAWSGYVTAAPLSGRSIHIPTAIINATTSHQSFFSFASSNSLGSIVFTYCDNSPLFEDPCTAPAGLDVSNVTLSSQSGQTGFSIVSATTSQIIISRPTLPVTPGPAIYTFDNAVNGSVPNKTTFVRISTHASLDGSGPNIDQGSVAFSLSSGLSVNAFVPPFLALCTGVTVAIDCTASNGTGINLGTLQPTQSASGATQVAAATNDATGYVLSIEGTTMTSGNNIIPALNTPTISSPGTGQFGINLRANSDPAAGHDPEGNGTANPAADYNQPNLFTFRSSDTIASASTATNFNRFTITYMVNVPFGQPPGVYATTLTYVAVASF